MVELQRALSHRQAEKSESAADADLRLASERARLMGQVAEAEHAAQEWEDQCIMLNSKLEALSGEVERATAHFDSKLSEALAAERAAAAGQLHNQKECAKVNQREARSPRAPPITAECLLLPTDCTRFT